MSASIRSCFAVLALAAVFSPAASRAADYGAAANGNWNSASTWVTDGTAGTTPGPVDDVYIGGYYTSGAILNPTVTLTQAQSTYVVYFGSSNGSSPTLNLNGNALTAQIFDIGNGTSSMCTLQRGSGGSLNITSAINVYNGNSFTFAAADATPSLTVNSGASVTTAVASNVTSSIVVNSGSTLNLGANLSLNNSLDLRGTLNANNKNISAPYIYLGTNGGPFTLNNRGTITSSSQLYVSSYYNTGGALTFNLTAADSVTSFNLSGVNTTLPAGAAVNYLNLSSNNSSSNPANSTASTSAAGNVSTSVEVDAGSVLTLNAPLTLSQTLDLRGTINANNNAISASTIFLGLYNGPFALNNRGAITATTSMYVSSFYSAGPLTFNLMAADHVNNLYLYGVTTSFASGSSVSSLVLTANTTGSNPQISSATTTAVGNITGSVEVDPGCTLTLGANLSLTSTLDLRGTLNANSHAISASYITLGGNGGPFTLNNRGAITANNLSVSSYYSTGAVTFNLTPADSVTNFNLSGVNTTFAAGAAVTNLNLYANTSGSNPLNSSATTTASGNITSNVLVDPTSTLNLGAPLTLTSSLDLRGTLNANNNAISASSVFLGYYGGPFTLTNRGALTASSLYVNSYYSSTPVTFNLTAADNVTNLYLYGVGTTLPTGAAVSSLLLGTNNNASPMYGTATTTAVGNITSSVEVDPGCTLTLGAPLSLTGTLNLGGTLNAANKAISANTIFLGYYSGPFTLTNRGAITTPTLSVDSYYSMGSVAFNLTAADSVSLFSLYGASTTLPTGAAVSTLNLFANGSGSNPQNSSATTTAVGNITGNVLVDPTSTLTLGAPLNLSGTLDLRGTLNAANKTITANTIVLGYYAGPFTITNRGAITASNSLYVDSYFSSTPVSFNLIAGDQINTLNLYGVTSTLGSGAVVANLQVSSNNASTPTYSNATTTTTGNITASIQVDANSTLNLGANLSLSNQMIISGTLNANSHTITTNAVYFGNYGGPFNVTNRGAITAGTLQVDSYYNASPVTFNLIASDNITNYSLYGVISTLQAGSTVANLTLTTNGASTSTASSATTTTVGNITSSVYLVANSGSSGSTLTLGANLNLSGSVRIDQGTLNAAGHGVTAPNFYFGNYGGYAVTVQNLGTVVASQGVYVGNGTTVPLASGADQINYLNISTSSHVKVVRSAIVGSTGGTGLTLTNSATGTNTLNIDGTSTLILDFPDALTTGGWALRWLNPMGSNHVAEINSLIGSGRIVLQFDTTSFTPIVQSLPDGYTYVGTPVPEPSLILLAAVPLLCWFVRRR